MSATLLRVVGGALLALSLSPVYRILRVEENAPVRSAAVSMAEATLDLALWGSLIVVLAAYLASRVAPRLPARLGRTVAGALARVPLGRFAVGVGIVGAGAATVVATVLYRGLLTSVDEMASIIHARFLAHGMLAGPAPVLPEGWLIPNMLMVPEGWVSQYPPSHLAIIALFQRLGVPLATGPVLFGCMVALVALALPRLVPGRNGAARVAAVLTAVSPLLLFLAGGMLSHLTAGAALALVAYASLRARDGHTAWAVSAGAAIGIAVSSRPLTGLVLGAVFPIALWWPRTRAGELGWGVRRVLALLAGGVPFALGLGAYNARLFGGPTRWGYMAAYGADHGLGFHLDPWGYVYGPAEALALSSTDLVQMGIQLLETPFPATAAVGLWLVTGRGLPRGARVLAAWALLPIAANALYWFHAPRMYFEAAPAWIGLAVLGVVAMSGGGGPDTASDARSDTNEEPAPVGRLGPIVGWVALLSLIWAVGWGAPGRWASYRWDDASLAAIRMPAPPSSDPALVFVHTRWTERISATLQGAGAMRQDSVTVALRRNGACALHEYAVARERRVREGLEIRLPAINLERRSGAPDALTRPSTGEGSVIRARPDGALTPACRREQSADRFGTVALAPLVWQGDLPGDERGDPMFVRDLGPEKNERIRAAQPSRTAFVFVPREVGAPPELVSYDEAMRVLWGEP